MKRTVLDEFHITVYVARDLPDKESLRLRRPLKSGNFTGSLIVLSGRFCRYPSLRHVRAVISQ